MRSRIIANPQTLGSACRHAVAVAAVLLLSSCGGGSTEPLPPAFQQIEISDTLTRSLRSIGVADTLKYVTTGPGRIHVELQQMVTDAQLLTLQWVLIDSVSGAIIRSRAGAVGRSSALANPDLVTTWATLTPGTYLILVNDLSLTFVGDYRIRVIGVADSRPESAPATLAAGDTVSDAIDDFGDHDEYIVSLGGASMDNTIGLRAIGTGGDTLIVERPVLASAVELVRSAGTSTALVPSVPGSLNLNLDTLRIRVRALRIHMRGSYRLAFYRVSRGGL